MESKQWEIEQKLGRQAMDLICRMLDPDPLLRPTITEVVGHDWFAPCREREAV